MSEFTVPEFTFWKVLVTAIGASILWARWSTSVRLRAVGVTKFLEDWGWAQGATFVVLEFVLFVTIGTLLGIMMTDPANARQALAAGLGWSGIFSDPGPARQPDDSKELRISHGDE